MRSVDRLLDASTKASQAKAKWGVLLGKVDKNRQARLQQNSDKNINKNNNIYIYIVLDVDTLGGTHLFPKKGPKTGVYTRGVTSYYSRGEKW